MELFLAQLVSGLSTGGIYALLVLGMNLITLVRNVVHHGFSHTCIFTMAVGWLVYNETGMPLLAFLAMFAAGVLITVLSEPLFRPLSKRGADLETIVLAMGIGIVHNTKKELTSFAQVSGIGAELKCLAKRHENGSSFVMDRRA